VAPGAPVLRVGLTGGLASGKSTVASILRDLGAYVIDADRIAHAIIAPGGAAHHPVVARFGAGILAEDGSIDRKKLAGIVFADPAAVRDLNAIVHPAVRDEIERRLTAHAGSPSPAPVAVVDAALLVESGIHESLDALVVVSCPVAVQLARALARGGLTEAEARARIAAQAPLSAKLAAADYVIDTSGTMDDTRRHTRVVWGSLVARR
jgi:dephospho-CoA kinase